MATYEELRNLFSDSPLRNRLEVAILIKARTVLESPSEPLGRAEWADAALTPSVAATEAKRMLSFLLGGIDDEMTITEILAISDVYLQAAVDSAVDLLYP